MSGSSFGRFLYESLNFVRSCFWESYLVEKTAQVAIIMDGFEIVNFEFFSDHIFRAQMGPVSNITGKNVWQKLFTETECVT